MCQSALSKGIFLLMRDHELGTFALCYHWVALGEVLAIPHLSPASCFATAAAEEKLKALGHH